MRATPPGVHPSPVQVRGKIAADRRVRRWFAGVGSFLLAGAAVLLCFAGVVWLPWYGQIVAGLACGYMMSVLFVVGHDAAHGTLVPSHRWNRILGRIAFLPALQPYTSWVHSHNRQHHSFTNIQGKDSAFIPLTFAEYQALPGWERWLYRQGRSWYGLGLHYFIEIWWKWEFFPKASKTSKNPKAFQRDRLMVSVFAVAWVALLVWLAEFSAVTAIWWLFVGFVLPQAAWYTLIGFITFQQHTHPRIPWYSAADFPGPSYFQMQIRATPHVMFPAFFRVLMAHIMEHTAHHSDPAVPHYGLAAAQGDLESTFKAHILRYYWTPRQYMQTVRTCHLYDFAEHRWLGYDGQPKSPRLHTPQVPRTPETAGEKPIS
ncbi:MAG: fatty acid desaturase [Fimbriiglobus sp.]